MPIDTPEEIAKILEEDMSFVKFIPEEYHEELAKILGYTREEFKGIYIASDYGII